MRSIILFPKLKTLMGMLIILFIANSSFSQTDTQSADENQDAVENEKKKDKKEKKKRDSFKIYAGANFNSLVIDDNVYKAELAPGYMLGFSYSRGRFFYWEVGARYNNPVYNILPNDSASYTDGLFAVRSIDVPITGGINFLSFASRIVGLRVFVSAIPSFAIGMGNNDINLNKDDLNKFNLFGQAGLGVDVAFLFLEGGVNFGFSDVLTNDRKTKPVQGFVSLGFRF